MSTSNPNNDVKNNEPKSGEDFEAYAASLLGEGAPVSQDNETPQPPKERTQSYQDKVNATMKEVTVGEDGKLVFPDGTPEDLRYAVAAEKKYRDTQASFTKGQQTLKEREAENKALLEQIANISAKTQLEIPEDQAERLEELKLTDPDQWRKEMNQLEQEHSTRIQQGLQEQLGEVTTKVGAEFEIQRRDKVLAEFNEGRKIPITHEILDNDIPPRMVKKLADGLVTFEGFLTEVDEYLSKGKVVSNPTVGNGTSLSTAGGSSEPAGQGTELEETALNYAQITF